MEYYTYELVDPRDGKTFYVGKGKGKRMFSHAKHAHKNPNTDKNKKIIEIMATGHEVVCNEIARFKSEKLAYQHERELVAFHGRKNLTNKTDGGSGLVNHQEDGKPDGDEELDTAIIRLYSKLVSVIKDGLVPCIRIGEYAVVIPPNNIEMIRSKFINVLNKRGDKWINAFSRPFGVTYVFK